MECNFRKTLREELDYQGLTVKELAARTAVPKGALDSYLGKQESIPPADTAVRIAEVLGVTVEYLVKGQEVDLGKNTLFVSNPRKRSLLHIFDELLPEDQKLSLEFVRLLRNRKEKNKE